ncbi:hypothetical protein [Streptomyces californicus]|uniref:hypothetical protein n=1 Tax=Streptomyces californicus TaxID=67351 RepID=UPI00296F3B78|nr:hypothetical protein [Streptomyces californicus]MDW4916933.1 hypothetical protein [Streptomyces californicus]
MSESPYDVGFARMETLSQEHSGDAESGRNEAATRKDLIDRLFFDVLQWPRDLCTVEESHGSTYTDYIFGNPEKKLIVEAKKEGLHFELPVDKTSRVVSLSGLTRKNGNLEAALKQVSGYCTSRGVALAAACNGRQLVAFIGSRTDGVAPMEGRALVFRNLEEMSSDFVNLWNNLAYPAIDSKQLVHALTADTLPPPPAKLSRSLVHFPGVKRRNDLELELRILGEIFLQDLVKTSELESDFLKECYCSSGALSQYALVSKEILRNRYSASGEGRTKSVTAARDKSGASKELLNAVIAKSVTQRPVILLGDVGVGKTSFINHLVSVEAKDELERGIVLYVDFGREPALRTDLEKYVLDSFERQLRNKQGIDLHSDAFVRGIYHGELVAMRKGIYGFLQESDPIAYRVKEAELLQSRIDNQSGHLKRAVEHLISGERRTVVAFLDNIDQRQDDFQEQVFLIAQSLAETWPITCFVTMRPSTYSKSRRQGSLSAYQNRVFTISPPRVDLVIKKRLEYALDKLINGGVLALSSEGISVESNMLREYIEVLIDSLERNSSLAECLDNVSAGNVRDALDLLTNFVGSGHVDTGKILEIKISTGEYFIPLHEFLRAVIYGDNEYYSPDTSFVANVFDIITPQGAEHFLTPFLLDHCWRSSQTSEAEKGYIAESDVRSSMQDLGYLEQQISASLDRAVRSKMLDYAAADESAPNRLRITQRGAYILQRLISQFVYLDAVVTDVPFVDEMARLQIRGNVHRIDERIERAKHLLSYLDRQWEVAPRVPNGFDWAIVSLKARHGIAEVERRINNRRSSG